MSCPFALRLFLIATLLWNTTPAHAQNVIDPVREYKVKAVFLYSFGRYVTWPDTAFDQEDGKFVIGVAGESPISSVLHRIAATRQLADRSIEVVQDGKPEDCGRCHILFVSRKTSAQLEGELMESLQERNVLIVGESPGFASRGGCINFFIDDDTVRFEINVASAGDHGLNLNAKLLNLGRQAKQQ